MTAVAVEIPMTHLQMRQQPRQAHQLQLLLRRQLFQSLSMPTAFNTGQLVLFRLRQRNFQLAFSIVNIVFSSQPVQATPLSL
jgi:hypothetical protein